MASRLTAVRASSGLKVRALLGGLVALAVTVPLLAVVPVTRAQTANAPVAVDVDLVDGGVWVAYSNGCVEERAWRQPFGVDVGGWHIEAGFSCIGSLRLADREYEFFRPHVMRASLALREGERVVELVPTTGDDGYWLVTSAGRVVTGGAAQHLGDLSAFTLNAPVVAAAPTESGNGYYMLAADGGVFGFGDAQFYGSVQGLVDEHVGLGELAVDHVTAPVVTLATTPAGYWLVAADGAVFPFGDAAYHGSVQDSINTGNQLSGVTRDWVLTPPKAPDAPLARDALSEPVIGVVPSGGGTGYQMVAADGGIFNFGVSQFHGSLPGRGGTSSAAVASDVTDSRSGYVILTEDGKVHRFGVMNGEWDPVGRAPTALTPTTLPASECRPEGSTGFPLPWGTQQPTGQLDVGVLFVEFDDLPADRERWPLEPRPGPNRYTHSGFDFETNGGEWLDLRTQFELTESYLESMSHGNLDVEFHLASDWISVGPLLDTYEDLEWSSRGLGGQVLFDQIEHVAAHHFDLSNNGLGFDILTIVFSRAGGSFGLANLGKWTSSNGLMTQDVVTLELPIFKNQSRTIWVDSDGNVVREEDTGTISVAIFWDTLAQKYVNILGLDSRSYRNGDAEWWERRRERSRNGHPSWFGLIGLSDYWPRQEHQRLGRPITLGDGRMIKTEQYTTDDGALEMLAWNRWRLGWLEAKQMVCLAANDGAVELAPLVDPVEKVVMASVRLSDTEFLVLEYRTLAGHDADFESDFRWGRGDRGYQYQVERDRHHLVTLSSEGVLAYVVDTSRRNGFVRMFAEDVLQPGEDWILSPGESRTGVLGDGSTLRLDVSEGSNGTARVEITTS